MNIWILDDQYGEKIYKGLSKVLTDCDFPVKNNVGNPVPFIDDIHDGDIILLDNYFPGKTREEPLGDVFLEKYIEKGLSCSIICISDYGKVLLDKYFSWDDVYQEGDIIGWCSSKEVDEILKILNSLEKA